MDIDELKSRIDLNDLSERLGWKRQGAEKSNGNALYHSPSRKDAQASVSVYDSARKWKDHATGEGGSCIDMIIYNDGLSSDDSAGAIRRLHEIYGWPLERPKSQGGDGQPAEPPRERSRAEYIADRCLLATDAAMAYLVEQRGITEEVAKRAVQKKAVGFNDYTSAKVAAGQPGHGGPAVAFIVRTLNPGHVVAVDLRYLDKDLNGGVKTQCQGEKHGYGWTSDIKRLHQAETVYLVESPINALSIECAGMARTAAFAIRGVANLDIDWSFLRNKQVILCMDNDQPFPDGHPQAGLRPGLNAAWKLHEKLTALDISALCVDQEAWEEINDVNDLLQAEGPEMLKRYLARIEQWLIPGMCGKVEGWFGKRRIYLPYQHDMKYWRYRVRPDFTSYVTKVEQDSEEGGEPKLEFAELAGFRVAAISSVSVQSATATMTGDDDNQPKTLFALSVQTTRHGPRLIRKVVEDDQLHNVDVVWRKFGAVYAPKDFLRMINLLENAVHIGARNAANFVGLCFKDGRLVVNEGPDCYFTNPKQQCPYHNLTFPSGSRQDARTVIAAFQTTFGRNAALLALIWGIGGHLKAMLGFWPHMQVQADKGAGKSTLIKRLERSIGFTMFSSESVKTGFRLTCSISHTSQPVGWEELSTLKQETINEAVGLLQQSYQYVVTHRNTEMTEFLLSAPVMLAGEDVPVRSLIGKMVRTDLKEKGPMMPDDLPRFPVRQWLEFLADFQPAQVRAMFEAFKRKAMEASRAVSTDQGAARMATNYAALLVAWRLLCEFAGIDIAQDDVPQDIKAQMNAHIAATNAAREPWIWIMETLLGEIAAHHFEHPYKWEKIDGKEVLLIRATDIILHLSRTTSLREFWNGLPVKSGDVLYRQLRNAEVPLNDDDHERTISGRRVGRMKALSLDRLSFYGLNPSPVLDHL